MMEEKIISFRRKDDEDVSILAFFMVIKNVLWMHQYIVWKLSNVKQNLMRGWQMKEILWIL